MTVQNAVYIPCQEGTYSSIYTQARYCQPCSVTCPNSNYESVDNQWELKTSNCTRTSNIVCEYKAGFWREIGDSGICRQGKEYGQGHGVTTQGKL
ncbi:hypothetical protein DPMN_179915 [Dreissena polymorpha]|uniref:TNFR-Cys domain-containing protein n=1 Tax=Dreissena polymorpha TaxID=45954 RepID=A0A9D4EEW9_DREPO|nr:hypothetical protein DPMN_179915 [Dreissena polymorpha]